MRGVTLSVSMKKLALFFLFSFAVNAQQESLRMVYPFLPLAINPADAGAMKVFSAKGVFRKKPLFQNIGGASSSQQFMSIDMPLSQGDWGLGFLGFNTCENYFFIRGLGDCRVHKLQQYTTMNFYFSFGRHFAIIS